MLKFQLQFVMIARLLLVCSNLLLSTHDCILTAEKLIIICLLILQVTLMTISTLIIKINNYVYLHCWPISVIPTCPPSSSWLGIVIGTVVTLIMAITVIVLVMTDLKCCRHSIASKHWNIYHFLLPWIYLAYISRKRAVYNPMISGFSASIVQLYSVSIIMKSTEVQTLGTI